MMYQQWEYLTIETDGYPGNKVLNEQGRHGWELVAIQPNPAQACGWLATFKRMRWPQ